MCEVTTILGSGDQRGWHMKIGNQVLRVELGSSLAQISLLAPDASDAYSTVVDTGDGIREFLTSLAVVVARVGAVVDEVSDQADNMVAYTDPDKRDKVALEKLAGGYYMEAANTFGTVFNA